MERAAMHRSNASKMKWKSWNPLTGCTKISAGCKHCYAERIAKHLQTLGVQRYQNGFQLTLHEDRLELPMEWKRPCLIFVNSMSDLFHEKVPLEFIQRVFDTIVQCRHHTFQILTKRSQRLREVAHTLPWPSNVWMGVSVEDSRVTSRVHDLQAVPAAVRFLSCEPLIGPIDNLPLDNIDWVVAGGESGPKARPIKQEWVESILRQCRKAEVPFFFKQWGGIRRDLAGRELHGHTYEEMPSAFRKPRGPVQLRFAGL